MKDSTQGLLKTQHTFYASTLPGAVPTNDLETVFNFSPKSAPARVKGAMNSDSEPEDQNVLALKGSPELLKANEYGSTGGLGKPLLGSRRFLQRQQSFRSIMQMHKSSLGRRVQAHTMRAKGNVMPGNLTYFGPQKVERISIHIIDYGESNYTEIDEPCVDATDENIDRVMARCKEFLNDKNSITWIHVVGIHNTRILERIGNLFKLHPLLLEDICETSQLTKIEEFEGYMSIFANMIFHQKKRVKLNENGKVPIDTPSLGSSSKSGNGTVVTTTVPIENIEVKSNSDISKKEASNDGNDGNDNDNSSRNVLRNAIQKKTKIQQISIVLSHRYLLSFEEENSNVFETIFKRIRYSKGKIRTFGTDYLAYTLLDVMIDYYFVIFENISNELEKIEERLFGDNIESTLMSEIHRVRRKLVYLRRAMVPMADIIKKLSHWHDTGEKHVQSKDMSEPMIKEATLIYFRDVFDSITQAKETLNTLREISNGLLDLYLSTIANKTNEVMKVLTIISTIFVPLTFIAGVYGMNFTNMPILNWEYGYLFSWCIMLTIGIAGLIYFRRKKFL